MQGVRQETMVKTIDARGLSCPQPAMMTRQALLQMSTGEVEVLVDSGTSRDNVSRLAANAGWRVRVDDQPDGMYRLVLEK
jgi:tRNA 2-thiouridine synthesizing protein A